MTLRIPRHKEEERKHEVHDKVHDKHPAIRRRVLAFNKVNRFFRKVGIVDQHELAKPDVVPEDTEREHKFAKVVQVVRVNRLEITHVLQHRNDQRDHCKATYPPGCKHIPTEHSREPVWIDAHHPVPRSYRGTYGEDHQEYRRQFACCVPVCCASIDIFGEHFFTDPDEEHVPKSEEHHHSKDEEYRKASGSKGPVPHATLAEQYFVGMVAGVEFGVRPVKHLSFYNEPEHEH